MTTIKIFNHWRELVLETTDETFEKDIKDNDLDLYFVCTVEYDNDDIGYDSFCSTSQRKITTINGRTIYAEYTISAEYKIDTKEILEALIEDFRTKKQPEELRKRDYKYRQYLRQTSQPTNKHLKPVNITIPTELMDE